MDGLVHAIVSLMTRFKFIVTAPLSERFVRKLNSVLFKPVLWFGKEPYFEQSCKF